MLVGEDKCCGKDTACGRVPREMGCVLRCVYVDAGVRNVGSSAMVNSPEEGCGLGSTP